MSVGEALVLAEMLRSAAALILERESKAPDFDREATKWRNLDR